MSSERRIRQLFWTLVAAATMHLGPQCGTGAPGATVAQLRFDMVSVVEVGGGAYLVSADVLVETDGTEEELQSWEMTLSWDSPTLVLNGVTGHPDFDDDGTLAVSAAGASGSAGPFADLRHGAPVAGPVRVATVSFQSTDASPASIAVTGRVARSDGSLVPLAPSDPISVP